MWIGHWGGGLYLMGKLCGQLVEGIKRKPQTSRDGDVPDKPIDGGLWCCFHEHAGCSKSLQLFSLQIQRLEVSVQV